MNEENKRFASVRQALGQSQGEFGKSIGLTQGAVSDIERSKQNIGVSESVRQSLYKKLNVNPIWFETGQGEMFRKGHSGDKDEKILELEARLAEAERKYIKALEDLQRLSLRLIQGS